MWNIFMLAAGIAMFVAGLLMAGHAPYQNWRYSSKWHNPERKEPVDANSDDYKNAVANMRITGGGLIAGGGILIAIALSDLGLIQ